METVTDRRHRNRSRPLVAGLRVTAAEMAMLRAAAEERDMSVSDLLRSCVLDDEHLGSSTPALA